VVERTLHSEVDTAAPSEAPRFTIPPALSSVGRGWADDDLIVQRLTGPPGETRGPQVLSRHLIALRVAGRSRAEWRVESLRPVQSTRTPGTLSVVPAGAAYTARWHGEAGAVLLLLSPDLVRRVAREAAGTDRVEVLPRLEVQDPDIHRIGVALQSELEASAGASPDRLGGIYVQSLAVALATRLLRGGYAETRPLSEDATRGGGLSPARLRRVEAYVRDRLAGEVRLEDLAAEAGVSLYHFARQFREATGVTPYQYVTALRVERAKSLLAADPSLTVCEVSLRVGCVSQSHFAALFRRATGLSPREYRRQML
jgi:AraC family transcriptional regulator